MGGRAHFREVITDRQGNVISGASVLVLDEGTSTPITQNMYSSDALLDTTPLSNPLTTDLNGMVSFYTTSPQDVDLTISKTGYTTQYLYGLPISPGGQVGVFLPTALVMGGAGAQGSSNIPAPADHAHGMPSFGGVADLVAGGAGVEGVASTVSRADHVHGLTDGFPGTVHPGDFQTVGVASSLSRSDHTHAVGTGTPGASAPGDAAAEGASTRFPRLDHKHSREGFGSPVASAPGNTSLDGTASTIAHSDHRHAREAYGVSADFLGANVYGNADEGVSTKVARADHAHDVGTVALWVQSRFSNVNISNSSAETTLIGFTPTVEVSLGAGRGIRGMILGEVINTDGGPRSLTFRLKAGGSTVIGLIVSIADGFGGPFCYEYTIFRGSVGSGVADFFDRVSIGGAANGTSHTGSAASQADTWNAASCAIGVAYNWASSIPQILVTAQLVAASTLLTLTGRPLPQEVF